jgi:hypothetical protein
MARACARKLRAKSRRIAAGIACESSAACWRFFSAVCISTN